ncbi:MAG TPA: hypothetical protein VGM18_07130 [Candidatus Sulfotelmatobacter sp.]
MMQPAGIAAMCLLATLLALPLSASAQNVTLQAIPFNPLAVAPGGTSASTITVGAINGFSGTVDLACAVTSTATTIVDPPVCTVSPSTVTPNASASATITTVGDTSTVGYSITITATPSSGAAPTPITLSLTVLAVTPTFTVTVEKAVSPSSVTAGNGGVGAVTINPINGYTSTGGITLSCASITPLVTIPPVCSFNPAIVGVNGEFSSTLTITTFGPIITGANSPPGISPRSFYALWMPLPMLAFVGLGAALGGTRSKSGNKKVCALLGLFLIGAALFLMPACGNTSPSTTTPNGVTPNNTYTFTLMGVDSNGVISSNTGSTTGANPTVSLTVSAPTP